MSTKIIKAFLEMLAEVQEKNAKTLKVNIQSPARFILIHGQEYQIKRYVKENNQWGIFGDFSTANLKRLLNGKTKNWKGVCIEKERSSRFTTASNCCN
jgi:hypothetical protein